jgi:hypothetical protein
MAKILIIDSKYISLNIRYWVNYSYFLQLVTIIIQFYLINHTNYLYTNMHLC